MMAELEVLMLSNPKKGSIMKSRKITRQWIPPGQDYANTAKSKVKGVVASICRGDKRDILWQPLSDYAL